MSKKKILVVDDVELMRKTMGDIVNSDPGLEVVGYAEDGMQAVKVAAVTEPINVINVDKRFLSAMRILIIGS